ncbi:MAG TPA: GAF domain-containing protein [Jatrophihabitans sp.]|nr:GAF domain-containing protein [Jatrophihabitans sp.]
MVPTRWRIAPRRIAPLALVLGLTIAGFFGARLIGERDAQRDSEHQAEVAAAQIHARVADAATLAASLGRYMASVGETSVTDEEFASNAARWLGPAGFPGAGWVEEVGAADRAAYEQRTGHPIVTRDQRRRIVPVESRSSYLPATLVSGIPPITVAGLDLGGESGMAGALLRARALHQPSATQLAALRDGTKGLFLVSLTQRGGVVAPGFAVVFVSGESLRAAAADTPAVQLAASGAATAGPAGAPTVRTTFTEAGQRFDVVVPLESVSGAAAVLPWIILAAGLVLAALAAALGVSAARRARAQQEVDRIFMLSSDLITVANFEGYFTRVNPAVERTLGYTEGELLARPYVDFVHPDDRERTAAETAAIGQGKTTLSFENRFVRKDGSHRVLEWTSTPAVEDRAMYAVARDVTDRHQAEAELARLAGEQAALRRVATLVARQAPQAEVFSAIAEEIGRLLGTDEIRMLRYEGDSGVVVSSWGEAEDAFPTGSRHSLGDDSVASRLLRTGQPARIDDYATTSGPVAESVRSIGIRSAVAVPIQVAGRLWGAMTAGTTQDEPLPADTESRMGQFTELIATAIANAEARAEVERLAQEQAALRRVATLVAEGASSAAVFDAVAAEMEGLSGADHVVMCRYEPGAGLTVLAHRSSRGQKVAPGTRISHEGDSVEATVRSAERSARIESYEGARGVIAELARAADVQVAVAAPIVVDGRLWGVVSAGWPWEEPPPGDTEQRMAQFGQLLGIAIANAGHRAELVASRARLVAASDDARRRFERDLHDGVQQRLVSLALELDGVQAIAPREDNQLIAQLAGVRQGLAGALDDLQELSRGIHPAVLSEGGLTPAVRVLARRSAVPVKLNLSVDERLADHVEVGAYYVVSEALTNAAKHAQASNVEVTAHVHDGTLQLRIDDDGVGGADPARGSGLTGLTDRVAALGGTIAIVSPLGRGTSLHVELPVISQ